MVGMNPRQTVLYLLHRYFYRGLCVFLSLALLIGFLAPFCIRWIYGGEIMHVQPNLIGIEGTMPIEQLERLTFGITGKDPWLRYVDPSGRSLMGGHPAISTESLPAGHRIFTLLDTASFPPGVRRYAKADFQSRIGESDGDGLLGSSATDRGTALWEGRRHVEICALLVRSIYRCAEN
ncbi:MAG: hypothetical protein Q9219_003477 [cf. Caloplaca sp. 3 TL-2023]